jgi:two-component system, response regulator
MSSTRYQSSRPTILMADDDEDDRDLVQDAFIDAGLPGQLRFVIDGQELVDYLRRHSGSRDRDQPAIILLDLNMPRKDGREALAEIKSDEALCDIPVVILTTSTDDEDIRRSYRLGANSFIAKPTTHAALVGVMRDLARYWFDLVELPR